MDITAVSFVTLDGLKEFLKKCKETFALKKDCDERWDSMVNFYDETMTDVFLIPHKDRIGTSASYVTVPMSIFVGNFYLKSVNLPAVAKLSIVQEALSAGAFAGCINLEKAIVPACTSVGNYAFRNCSSLASIDLPACTSVGYYAFQNCSSLASVNIPLCEKISTKTFANCTALESINLPVCTSAVDTSFTECDNLKEIHFAAANQATIEALSGYASKFGATNATIYFDL